jgi:hypothetical protein
MLLFADGVRLSHPRDEVVIEIGCTGDSESVQVIPR